MTYVQEYPKAENVFYMVLFSHDPAVKLNFRYCQLEEKLEGVGAQGRRRRMWLDDIKLWTKLNNYEAVKRLSEDRHQWRDCTTACQPSEPEDDN